MRTLIDAHGHATVESSDSNKNADHHRSEIIVRPVDEKKLPEVEVPLERSGLAGRLFGRRWI